MPPYSKVLDEVSILKSMLIFQEVIPGGCAGLLEVLFFKNNIYMVHVYRKDFISIEKICQN